MLPVLSSHLMRTSEDELRHSARRTPSLAFKGVSDAVKEVRTSYRRELEDGRRGEPSGNGGRAVSDPCYSR